jgi:hypothetical protein
VPGGADARTESPVETRRAGIEVADEQAVEHLRQAVQDHVRPVAAPGSVQRGLDWPACRGVAPPRHSCHRHSPARCRFSVERHREAGRSRRCRPREISRHCAGERPQKPSAPESSGRAASPSC